MSENQHLLQENPETPWNLLSADRSRKAIAIRDYMLGEGRTNGDANITLTELSERF